MDADDKQPVIGAIVTEKGSNRCTVTDVNGEFSIKTERGSDCISATWAIKLRRSR